MSVTVLPAMGLTQNGIVGDKLAQQMIPLSLLSSELDFKEEDFPLLSHGQHMQYMKEEDFTCVRIDCERVPGDASTAFAAFMVHMSALSFPSGTFCKYFKFQCHVCALWYHLSMSSTVFLKQEGLYFPADFRWP